MMIFNVNACGYWKSHVEDGRVFARLVASVRKTNLYKCVHVPFVGKVNELLINMLSCGPHLPFDLVAIQTQKRTL